MIFHSIRSCISGDEDIRSRNQKRRARMPALLFPVDEQRARQELHFVVECLQHQRSGQERRIHEDALSKWGIVRHGLGLFESQNFGREIRRQNLIFKNDPGISDP